MILVVEVSDGTLTHTVDSPDGFHVSTSCARRFPFTSVKQRSLPFPFLKSE